MHCLIDSQYFPPIEYFCAWAGMDGIIIEKHEHYLKQTYRNRCYINTSNELMRLSVPIAHKGETVMENTIIAEDNRWRSIHWRSIISAYHSSPFFSHYADEIRHLLFGHSRSLYALNQNILTFCMQALQWHIPITETTSYQKNYQQDVIDLRSTVTPKKSFHSRSIYRPQPYKQVFGHEFIGNLTIIDLLCCEGPYAMEIIQQSSMSSQTS